MKGVWVAIGTFVIVVMALVTTGQRPLPLAAQGGGQAVQLDCTWNAEEITLICTAADGNPTPEPTHEVTPEPTDEGGTPEPTHTPEPTPSGSGGPGAFYGDFPNGKNGGVCAESHAWWLENGEAQPRHSHSGACVPAARGKGGKDGPFVSNIDISARALAFNMPGEVNWHRAQWQGNTVATHGIGERCQNSVGEFKECHYWQSYNLSVDSGEELRLATDVRNGDLGTRQYSVINFQVSDGGGVSYRGGPWIIGRHWYDGFGYVRVYLLDYMEYVKPEESMPTVSGNFSLKVKHDGSNCTEGQLFINPQFHTWHAQGSVGPAPDQSGGCGSHTYTIDTTKLGNGRNTLYFQTMAQDGKGELASAVLVFVDVQN